MLRNPGSFTSGEIELVLVVGPNTPATKRGLFGIFSSIARAASFASFALAEI